MLNGMSRTVFHHSYDFRRRLILTEGSNTADLAYQAYISQIVNGVLVPPHPV
jgi:hypothetical protein